MALSDTRIQALKPRAAPYEVADDGGLITSVLNSPVYRRFGTGSVFPVAPSVHQRVTDTLMYVKPGQGRGARE
jgi:hypothetical protein